MAALRGTGALAAALLVWRLGALALERALSADGPSPGPPEEPEPEPGEEAGR